jgi:hypothetical protein
MNQRQGGSRNYLFLSLTLLAAAVVAYIGCIVTVATGTGFLLFLLTIALLVAGACVSVGAVATGTRIMDSIDTGQRRVLIWSLWSLAFLLTSLVILLGTYGILATPACRAQCTPSIAYAFLGLFFVPLLGLLSIIPGMVAGVAGLVSAATSGRWGWFAALIAYLVGSWLSAVLVNVLVGRRVLSVDSPVVVLFISPLQTPVLTVLYSLSGRERSAPA